MLRTIWSLVPPFMFNPKEGNSNLDDYFLTLKPSLELPEELKFAAINDPRFRLRHLYKKLEPFLPDEFDLIAPPNRDDCSRFVFGRVFNKKYCWGVHLNHLLNSGYELISFDNQLAEIGDVVVYTGTDVYTGPVWIHVARYVGNSRVRSRWGFYSPVIESPIDQIYSSYWTGKSSDLQLLKRS